MIDTNTQIIIREHVDPILVSQFWTVIFTAMIATIPPTVAAWIGWLKSKQNSNTLNAHTNSLNEIKLTLNGGTDHFHKPGPPGST